MGAQLPLSVAAQTATSTSYCCPSPIPHSAGPLIHYWLLAQRVAEARIHCSQREWGADVAGCSQLVAALGPMPSAVLQPAAHANHAAPCPAAAPAWKLQSSSSAASFALQMLLGAVGSFFSGSVATSNMTFGLLQQVQGCDHDLT